MKIKIKRWDNGKIIIAGEYANIKDAIEKAVRDKTSLDYAELDYASLVGASLDGARLDYASLVGAKLDYSHLFGASLFDASLFDASLVCARLDYSNLFGAKLFGANLVGARLYGVKNYSENYSVFQQLIRAQDSKVFTAAEWAIIGFMVVHRTCWESIKKRFGKKIMSIFKKLSRSGFDEYEKKYSKVLKESKE